MKIMVHIAVAAFLCAAISAPAETPGLKSLLGQASDSALSQLEKPGAFYADQAVRIVLPGKLKSATKILKLVEKTGLVGDLSKTMNDAAGIAAGAAKPVFRSAIDQMTLQDGIGIATGGGTAATDYLKKSSGATLHAQLRPIVESALGKTGALKQFERISKSPAAAMLGLSASNFTDSITEQTANGIFLYMGKEETSLRQNPLGIVKKILKKVK